MEDKRTYRSDFLFSETSFLIGVGSSLNLAGNYFEYAVSETPEKADLKAIENDWNMVGEDLKLAFLEYIQNRIKLNAKKNEAEKETA